MRVAVVASSRTSGGAEQYLYRLYTRLRADYGVEPTLIGELPDWPLELGDRVQAGVSPKLTMKGPLIRQAEATGRATASLIRAVKAGKYDLVHVQFMQPKLVAPVVLRRFSPVLWTEHGPLPQNLPKLGRMLLRWQAHSCTVVAVSEAVGSSLLSNSINSTVVWNPLPPATRRELQPVAGDGRRRVLYAGRIHRAKRLELLLKAAELMPSTDFIIAGDGPDRETYERISGRNVKFVGLLPQIDKELDLADVVVICSGREAREGSPMVMLEGRSAGVAVLMASDCHAASEAESIGCTLFEPRPSDLASKLEAIRPGGRVPIDAEVLLARSEQTWAREHYNLMLDAIERFPAC